VTNRPLTEYDVSRMIDKDRLEHGPGCIGGLFIVAAVVFAWFVAKGLGEDFKEFRDYATRLEALEAAVFEEEDR
jgi:hypothetical protein